MLKNERELLLKLSRHLRVSYVEQWRSIILYAHGGTSHYPLSQTIKELKKHWAMDFRDHGITSAYVFKALIDQCGCQIIQKVNSIDILGRIVVTVYDKATMPKEMI